MSEWQPIDTAPKGDPGPEIVCKFYDGREETLHWVVLRFSDTNAVAGGWWYNGDRIIRDAEPQPVLWRPSSPGDSKQ